MNDKWEFKKSNLRKWRWRHISANGDTIGRAHMGFSSRIDCEENAHRNGWLPENVTEVDVTPGKSMSQEDSSENKYRLNRDAGQRKMLVLITSFLGLILIATLFILFKSDPEEEATDINSLLMGKGHYSTSQSALPNFWRA